MPLFGQKSDNAAASAMKLLCCKTTAADSDLQPCQVVVKNERGAT